MFHRCIVAVTLFFVCGGGVCLHISPSFIHCIRF
ncbi:hypothetical protein, unlikely [Trypanosoma brucei brucei TREU927]|uniref:Uncharacterized protein n=1 Tax=Trypanosoma brucei brucei (strain 927/4 GUTat10.1) TaxID=185431 RepID=Q38F13_TRYB2|nr:hypothetical protein, unlikely [Trypanosoma brucei brucei TREU927]EAN76607.1 hypothetical protein, unlikely [Trypanosoma brucei brucei TREU927]